MSAPHITQPSEFEANQAELEYECIRVSKTVTNFDLSDDLYEAGDEILAAINTGSAELVGKVVLAVHSAYVRRVAEHCLGWTPTRDLEAETVARKVLDKASAEMANTLAARNGAHNSRRFDARPLTGFGELARGEK